MSQTTSEYAKDYLSRGFSIIPIKCRNKKPLLKWFEYQSRKASDEEVTRWFGNGCLNNIAIVTGANSGVAVLDFDSTEAFEKYAKDLPLTPTVKTARGYHAYYRYKDGIRNFQKRDDLHGIDLRGDGGYVVAPPSVHSSGHQYRWVEGRGLDNIPLADFPEIFLARGVKDKKPLAELYKGVPEGQRNNSLARLAGSWVNDGLTFGECVENALLWNEKNDPQLERSEVEQTVRSIFERHHGKNGDHEGLIKKYGNPYYFNAQGKVSTLNESYWAGLHIKNHIEIYEPDEKSFYRYDELSGLYKEITQDVIKQEVSDLILGTSKRQSLPSLESKRTNVVLNNIANQLRGLIEKRNAFKKNKNYIHLANGVIVFNESGEMRFEVFSPEFYSRNQSPIRYDENAKCERFFDKFLYPAIRQDDATLIQKYTGLCLLGNNLPQRFLIFDGEAGTGKSTLSAIIQKVVGIENVTQLRTQHLAERFELYRFLKKSLLIGVDVPANFLSMNGAHVLKGLVGGDFFDAEQKGGTGSFPIQGNFCIVITSNSHLQMRFEGDIGAWRRRLLIVRFEGSPPKKRIPNFADVFIREEGSGILNWALEGLRLLLADIQQYGDISLTTRQVGRIEALLSESDSLRIFLMENVINDNEGDLTVAEITERYAEYCPTRGWNPKPITVIYKELEGFMLELFRVSRSNSIERDGRRSVKGFRNVSFKKNENMI